MSKDLYKYLAEFVTENRLKRINDVAENRSDYITVALEDIYQSQNASAVLRTCDCFGLNTVHIIETKNEYEVNPDVALGSSQWLHLEKYNNTANNTIEAIKKLKSQGYRIVATTPHTNDVSLENFDLSKGKIALFFGTELEGLSKEMLDNADEYLKIDMYGFTESFNISVSAGIILHHLVTKLRNSTIDWKLPEEQIHNLKIEWLKTTIKKSELLIKNFEEKKGEF